MRSEGRVGGRRLSTGGQKVANSGRSRQNGASPEWRLPRTCTVDDRDIFDSRQFFAERTIRIRREERDRDKFQKQAKVNENNAPFYIDPDDPFDLKGLEEEEKRLQEEYCRELENDDAPQDPWPRRRRRSRHSITVFSSDEDDEQWDVELRISEAKRETQEVQERLAEAEAKIKEWEGKEASDLEQQQKWEDIEEEADRETHRYKTETLSMIGKMEAKENQLEEDLNRLWLTIGEDQALRECQEWAKAFEDLIQQKEEYLQGQQQNISELSERELAGPAILKGEAKMLIQDEKTLKCKVLEQDCMIADLLEILQEAEYPQQEDLLSKVPESADPEHLHAMEVS
ncbi:hypothetical protein BSKO_09164 [Bryopsis sp. KO-2023]|nr:hypothetical protein BSKO_09164 [Bryopsis sp. KO-2023]